MSSAAHMQQYFIESDILQLHNGSNRMSVYKLMQFFFYAFVTCQAKTKQEYLIWVFTCVYNRQVLRRIVIFMNFKVVSIMYMNSFQVLEHFRGIPVEVET